jgi:hypothetical protein
MKRMESVKCPMCHGTGQIPVPSGRDTIRMTKEQHAAMLEASKPSPLPPPPRLPRPIRDSELDVTMPGTGWFHKHIKQQVRIEKRRQIFLLMLAIVIICLVAFAKLSDMP